MGGHAGAVRALLDLGASPHALSAAGETPAAVAGSDVLHRLLRRRQGLPSRSPSPERMPDIFHPQPSPPAAVSPPAFGLPEEGDEAPMAAAVDQAPATPPQRAAEANGGAPLAEAPLSIEEQLRRAEAKLEVILTGGKAGTQAGAGAAVSPGSPPAASPQLLWRQQSLKIGRAHV